MTLLEAVEDTSRELNVSPELALKLEALATYAWAYAYGDNRKRKNAALFVARVKGDITNEQFDELVS